VVPSYLQALHTVARTDLVAFVPRRLIETLASPLALVEVRPPIDPGLYDERLFRPLRAAGDSGIAWLRQRVLAGGKRLHRR
jgi:hypothetical protein